MTNSPAAFLTRGMNIFTALSVPLELLQLFIYVFGRLSYGPNIQGGFVAQARSLALPRCYRYIEYIHGTDR